MRKNTLLHTEINWLLSDLGHKDRIVVADAGLPVPGHVRKIDLALTCGMPDFISVLEVIDEEFEYEEGYLAEEIKTENPSNHKKVKELLNLDNNIFYISHEQFKKEVAECRAVIRTGECTPYSNIILTAGVIF